MSMPGMMDTVLNLGLNDESINGLIKQTENPRFALGLLSPLHPDVLQRRHGARRRPVRERHRRHEGGARRRSPTPTLPRKTCKSSSHEFKGIFTENVDGEAYPALVVDGAVAVPAGSRWCSCKLAIEAVFGSWNNPRAVLYRQKKKIADDLGTAVNVQSMVFGNKGDTSATGVAFTRNPANGANASSTATTW